MWQKLASNMVYILIPDNVNDCTYIEHKSEQGQCGKNTHVTWYTS